MHYLLSLVVALGFVAYVSAADVPARPNVIVIMSDDMGFTDLGCYGGEVATPTLDSLAKDGLRFTQFYNAARCCPTRAALLSGLYSHQTGVGHMMDDLPDGPASVAIRRFDLLRCETGDRRAQL